jgi:hypothetical protein
MVVMAVAVMVVDGDDDNNDDDEDDDDEVSVLPCTHLPLNTTLPRSLNQVPKPCRLPSQYLAEMEG